jgi:hypothetical protein
VITLKRRSTRKCASHAQSSLLSLLDWLLAPILALKLRESLVMQRA